MRTALKVTLIPGENQILFDAGIGVFGQQFIPTIISMFFAWPVLLTQIWGLVQQANLDNQALEIAEKVVVRSDIMPKQIGESFSFCTNCGSSVSTQAKFCPNCGTKLI